MDNYPKLNDLRKKEAADAVVQATEQDKQNPTMANNPLAVKKIKKQHSRKTWTKVLVAAVAVVIIGGTIFGARMLTLGDGGDNSAGLFGQLKSLFGEGQPLIGESQDRVNFLLLGIGGEGHDGPNLSDTVVIASIKPSTKDVALLSLPRDFMVEVPGYGFTKLNSAFALGEESGYPGGGAALSRETIEPIVGLDIPYYVVADFEGFKQIVDDLGGIDVEIQADFTDYWHGISYYEGNNHFDGEEALLYVRARYIEGPEGGDFARAGRTQQALLALRDKALEVNLVSDFGKITDILGSVGEHVRTNLNAGEMRRVYELVGDVPLESIQSKVIDDGETGLLYSEKQPIGGVMVFVLVPSDPSYEEIRDYTANIFEPAPPEPEDATVEILNGTTVVGIATTLSNIMETPLQITGVDNADDDDHGTTIIVDNTDGDVPIISEMLKQELIDLGVTDVRVVSSSRYPNNSFADILVIVGEDFAEEQGLL